jgi:hypothetical protein
MGLTKDLGALPRAITVDSSNRVGIGVTPSAWRSGDVVIDLGATTSLVNAQGLNTRIYTNAFVSSSVVNTYKTTNFATYYDQGSGQHRWFNAPSGTAGNAISFTQAMTLDASGRLGIGATSMTYALQVNDVSGGNMFRFASGSTVLDYFVSGGNPSFGTASNNDLRFRTNDTERLRIFSNGNVFIGPSASDAGFRLDVNGTFRSTALWTTAGGVTQWGNAGTAYGGLTWDTGYAAIYGTGGNDLRFGADGSSPKMILKTSGNVGIGTTSPTNYSGFNTLQITGKSDTGGGVLRLTSFDSSAGVNFYAQTGGIFTNTTTSSPIVWLTQDTERMRITSDGLVYMYEVYNNTSGSGANVGINSLGLLYRSTSSLKYKKNVENYEKGLDVIMQMRPVTYNSINENEDGLQYAGLIAEEIHELGLTEFVQYAEDGSPDALSYANMVSLLVKGIQELKAEIEILKQNK